MVVLLPRARSPNPNERKLRSSTMKLKIDSNGNAVLQDGMPVYIHDDGKEVPFDAANAMASIKRLNAESRDHRVAKEEALAKLEKFGDLDVEAARKALTTVKNLDDKKLVDAGEVDKIKESIRGEYEKKLAEREAQLTELNAKIFNEKLTNTFAGSKFVTEKMAIPPDIVQSVFGARFKMDGDKLVAFDERGERVRSRVKPGDDADFDEALSIIVDGYPRKEAILKADQKGGSGAPSGGGSGGGGSKTVNRARFETMNAAERMDFTKNGGVIKD